MPSRTPPTTGHDAGQPRLLVVDDDPDMLRLLSMRLGAAGYRVTAVASAEAALSHLDIERPQVVLSDVRLPGKDGLSLFDEIRRRHPSLPVILLTAHGTIPDAVEATSRGVFSYLTKPYDARELLDKIAQAVALHPAAPAPRSADDAWRAEIISRSSRMADLLAEARLIAQGDASVLLRGDSGTGKEVLARAIHKASRRAKKPFVAVNCGAIPEALLESELFGHVKGAFTDAHANHKGLFQAADGGTLLLDEIGDMPPALQVKLLRVLQEKTFERVGSNKTLTADVRIVAATHRNLEKAIEDGKFREDLYYRLNVFPIEMPPLRERSEDVPLLIRELVTRLEHEKRGSVRLTQAAILALMHYHWPGNVRELANAMERLVIMHPYGVVDVHDLPPKYQPEPGSAEERITAASLVHEPTPIIVDGVDVPRLPRDGIDLKQHLTELECNLIKQALEDAEGIVAHAANRLGLRRTTLVEKLRKYGLQRADHVT